MARQKELSRSLRAAFSRSGEPLIAMFNSELDALRRRSLYAVQEIFMKQLFRSSSATPHSTRRVSRSTGWSKADLHLHTTHSDGLMTPEETIDIIANRGNVQVIAVTDHDTTDGAFIAQKYARAHHPQLDVIVGQEVTTGEGDVLGLYLKSTLPQFDTAAEAIRAIHQQEGLAVAAHPFVGGFGVDSVRTAIARLPFDAIEVRHGCPLSLPSNWWAGYTNRFGQRLPELGGSDSHIPFTVGEPFTWFTGVNSLDLRQAIRHNRVRPGGALWSVTSMLRKIPVLIERGWEPYSHEEKQTTPAPQEHEGQFVHTP